MNELFTAKPNTSKEKTLTNDLKKSSLSDEDCFNTKAKQHNHSNREAENGNYVNDDKARTTREELKER